MNETKLFPMRCAECGCNGLAGSRFAAMCEECETKMVESDTHAEWYQVEYMNRSKSDTVFWRLAVWDVSPDWASRRAGEYVDQKGGGHVWDFMFVVPVAGIESSSLCPLEVWNALFSIEDPRGCVATS